MAFWIDSLFPQIYCGAGDTQKSLKKMAKQDNSIELQNWYARCISDALDRYDLEGVPDTCSKRVIKMALLFYGSCVFFDKNGSLLALPGMPTEDFNVYGDPGFAWVFGRNGTNERVKLFIPGGENSQFLNRGVTGVKIGGNYAGVFVRENYLMFPMARYVMSYALRLADTFRAMDVVRKNLKRPYCIVAEESCIKTVREYLNSRDENVEAIVSTGIFPVEKVKILPFDTQPDALKSLQELHEWYYNQFKSLCGLANNPQSDKKERLLVDEVNADADAADMQLDKVLECLNEHLDYVNQCFGTSMKAVPKHKDEGKEENDDDDVSGSDDENADDV